MCGHNLDPKSGANCGCLVMYTCSPGVGTQASQDISNCKRIGHFSIENHHFSGVILHSFYIFNGTSREKLALIFILEFEYAGVQTTSVSGGGGRFVIGRDWSRCRTPCILLEIQHCFNRKSGLLIRKSGFSHWKLTWEIPHSMSCGPLSNRSSILCNHEHKKSVLETVGVLWNVIV